QKGFSLKTETSLAGVTETHGFFSSNKTMVFDADMHLYKHHFNGLLVIKQTTLNNYRIVFTPKVGPKLFDMSIDPKDRTVHYCMEAIDRKLLLKALENDFRLLLLNFPQQPVKQYKNDSLVRYQLSSPDNVVVEKQQNDVIKYIRQGKWHKPNTQVAFFQWQEEKPESIAITHSRLKLSIHLKSL
ncbi:MAG: hypothetical protein R6U66_13850, partial [Bacteroidales bacterium]